jgi:spore maturation protein CgeB
LTPRPQFAAACGVPSLVEAFPLVAEMFEPGREIVTFDDEEGLLAAALDLLADDDARQALGRAALERVRGTHTWDHRVRQILGDLRLEVSP